MSAIKRLSESSINRIAAGEVVERPSSVLKELIENSIDAGATTIEIIIEQAGKNLLSIKDNGSGMSKEDLLLAVERHTTSKLDEDNIMDIHSFGFRGEALPSIASVSRTTISSCSQSSDTGYTLSAEGGEWSKITAVSRDIGTTIQVRDLFYATPARLKFLKADRTESNYCLDIVRRIALAHPHVGFSFTNDGRKSLDLKPYTGESVLEGIKVRSKDLIGKDFINAAVNVDTSIDGVNIRGLIGMSTAHKATSEYQWMYVNNRPVKDKLLSMAIRIAYKDIIPPGRHAMLVLFLELPPYSVDVNVHPAKSEVRFRDNNLIKNIVIVIIKNAFGVRGTPIELVSADHNTPTQPRSQIAVKTPSFNVSDSSSAARPSLPYPTSYTKSSASKKTQSGQYQAPKPYSGLTINKLPQVNDITDTPVTSKIAPTTSAFPTDREDNLNLQEVVPTVSNNSRGKLLEETLFGKWNDSYIIWSKEDKLIITYITNAKLYLQYHALQMQIQSNDLQTYRLTAPEILELDTRDADSLIAQCELLKQTGLSIKKFGDSSIIVTEIPNILVGIDITIFITKLVALTRSKNSNDNDFIAQCLMLYSCYSLENTQTDIANLNDSELILSQLLSLPNYPLLDKHYPLHKELSTLDVSEYFRSP